MIVFSRIQPTVACFLAALSLSSGAFAQSAQCDANTPAYEARTVTSNGSVPAAHTDTEMRGPWGLAFDPDGFAWVGNKGSGRITVYDGTGQVHFPIGGTFPIYTNLLDNDMERQLGMPTGAAYLGAKGDAYDAADFGYCGIHALCGTVQFVFGDRNGVIWGWAPPGTGERVTPLNRKSAVYTGVATGADNVSRLVYAADFLNRRIDVLNGRFQYVELPAGAFQDPGIPAQYGPFGIQNIAGDIYVSYARRHPTTNNAVNGVGAGYISVFDSEGRLIKRLVSRGVLNAPWGMALAPKSFGCLGGSLLVSNFGAGTINAYDLHTGGFLGTLSNQQGQAISIAGLRGIAFGNGVNNQPSNTLFFTAAPVNDGRGIFGAIDAR